MNDLIERIEAASGPSKAFDREIALAVGWVRMTPSEGRKKYPTWYHPDDCRDGHVVFDSLHGTDVWRDPLPYSTSIDAALTLVPEGFEWSLEYQAGHHVSSDVECMIAIAKLGDPCRDWESTSYTPALALCAAALKSRAYLKETNNAD